MSDPLTLEHRGWEALSSTGEAARAFYDEVLAVEVTMLLPGGLNLRDRDRILDSMSGAPWTSHSLSDERAVALAPDVEVVAYRVSARREGEPAYAALCSSTYVRSEGAWRMVFHQQTPVTAS